MKEYMDQEKLKIMKENSGFIAALDQSGGSTAKTLEKYGIPKDTYSTEEEMFEPIHEMRKRVFTSKVFTNDKILGCILFYKTMNSKVGEKYTADYLWEDKKILSFLKVVSAWVYGVLFYSVGLLSITIIISSHAAIVYSLVSRSNIPFLYSRILTFQLSLLQIKVCHFHCFLICFP